MAESDTLELKIACNTDQIEEALASATEAVRRLNLHMERLTIGCRRACEEFERLKAVLPPDEDEG